MTWQRIDEDTFIDDTLVTCAEYQLFIDEMGQQGKYYQPDHWTSYQFPAGKARNSILGVRYSDALFFCNWLMKKSEGVWRYRLPLLGEVVQHPLNNAVGKVEGYWGNSNQDNNHLLFWNDRIPTFACGIYEPDYIDLDKFKYIWAQEKTVLAIDDVIDEIRRKRRKLAFDLDRLFEISIMYSFNLSHILSRESKFLARSQKQIIETVELIKNLANEESLSFIRSGMLIENSREWYLKTRKSIHELSEMAINLLIFQERIAGRSPAFEGIRLVKERIK